MHAIKEKPVVVDGQIVIRPIMAVALTYDHRLLDGREAVTFLGMCLSFSLGGGGEGVLVWVDTDNLVCVFLVKVRDYIEDPLKMLLA